MLQHELVLKFRGRVKTMIKKEPAGLLRKASIAFFTFVMLLSSGIIFSAEKKTVTILGYAVIPDLVQTLEVLEKIAGAVDPVQFQPGSIKSQFGVVLNDPDFQNLDRTKPLVVMVFHKPSNDQAGGPGSDIYYSVFLPAKDKAQYKKVLEAGNMLCEISGGNVIASNNKSALDMARGQASLYNKIAAQKAACNLRMLVKIDSVMKVYKREIDELMKQMQEFQNQQFENPEQQEQMALAGTLLKIYMHGIYELFAQSKDYQLDITLDENKIVFSSEHSTRPGTALNLFFDSAVPGKNKCITLLPEGSDFSYAGYFDMARCRNLIDSIISGAVRRDPSLKQNIDMNIIDAYKKVLGMYDGEIAFVYGFDNSGRLKMDFAAATGSSAEEHLAVNEKFIEMYNQTVKKLLQNDQNLPAYTLQKNIRKSSGYDVHRYTFNTESISMSEDDKDAFRTMFGDEFRMEYAVCNGYVVASTDPQGLDRIIKNTITGGNSKDLQAIINLGPGYDSYADFDIIGLLAKISEMESRMGGGTAGAGMQNLVQELKKLDYGDRIITYSSKYRKGSSYSKYHVPVKIITEAIRLSREQNLN